MVITPTRERIDTTFVIPELDQWIELYLDDCQQQLHKPTTITHYANALKRFALWYGSQRTDGEIDRRNAKHFAYWLSHMKQKYDDHPGRPTEAVPLSPATVRRTVGVVRTFLTWLYREDYLAQDVSGWFVMPKLHKMPKKMIEVSTLSALFQGAAQGELAKRDTALIAILADTGLRQKEVTLLAIDQVCWLDEQGSGYLRYVRGKGDTLRDVPFSSVVGTVLRDWLAQRAQWLERLAPTSVLFITREGKALHPASVYQVLHRCAVRSGVEDEVWNTHSLRHSFATHFWRVQRDTKSLSLILGHSGQKVTEDIYVHPVPEDLLQMHTSLLATGQVTPPSVPLPSRPTPSKFLLRLAIQERPNWRSLGQQFHMSDVGIRKLAKKYELLETYHEARSARREGKTRPQSPINCTSL